ncbi:hypothetical protein GUJ93_ZPchr0011g28360 [Zizania palustris]|uniref:Uncharacterized protein n=1 Tax=Zizania palustris TaxID=103762 RepID=A0A8J6BRF7_ZIZPA|nr:hypothetical protein GUJ93_ZPchr0011g28360 [Zizania palustris]
MIMSHTLFARELVMGPANDWILGPHEHPRFTESAELQGAHWFDVSGKIAIKQLELDTTYRAYLVYKLAPNHDGLHNVRPRSEIRLRSGEVYLPASEDRIVRLVVAGGHPPPQDDGPAIPVETGDDGLMEMELGWFQIRPEHVQGPDAVIARISMANSVVPMRGLLVVSIEFTASGSS